MIRLILFCVAILAGVFGANTLTQNTRAIVAEPATSATSVIATSGLAASNATANAALGTAHVILQLTLCVIPFALLIVIALALVAFIVARKNQVAPPIDQVVIERAPRVGSPPAEPIQPWLSDGGAKRAVARGAHRASRRVRNGAARIVGRWFR